MDLMKTTNCEKGIPKEDWSSLTRPESKPEKCSHCNGTGENHYHDESGCHLKCEYCNGSGDLLSLSKDVWV